MNFTAIILNILLISVLTNECPIISEASEGLQIKLKTSAYSSQSIDTIKPKNSSFYLLVRGSKNYDILLTSLEKKDYDEAKQIKTTQLLDTAIIPSQVNFTEDCYTVTTETTTIKNCLEYDEQLISISYEGYIKKLNSCVVYENWFESTISNLIINLEDGVTSYISGDELIFSPNLKFIYSYANDGIDFDGISIHQMIDKKAQPILITDYVMQEKYSFDFSSFGKVYWDSDNSFIASNDNGYYKFEIQDKRITYRNELKENIIHSENKKFIIKVDKLKDGSIRYTSWNKPNTTKDRPSLVLYNGELENQNEYRSGFQYGFKNGEYRYIIENNIEITTDKSLMLKIYRNKEEKLYTSLTDLTKL